MENKQHTRKANRLREYDYSNGGYYFITICVDGMYSLLGEVVDGKIELNQYGNIIEKHWLDIPHRFNDTELDHYIIMPNHFHGILIINENQASKRTTLPAVIGAFKSLTTIEIRKSGCDEFKWQRSYYDRIIRNETELFKIRRYIELNPLKWDIDRDSSNIEL